MRETLEQRVRKLSDELNGERSERALAQGALESARRTRAEVERELFQMRKGLGEVRKLSEELNSDRAQRAVHGTGADNVRLFKSPE
jgi:chromosome segregation ATPase